MTPKEKTLELYDKFGDTNTINGESYAKECALITVEEIIEVIEFEFTDKEVQYWREVKNELEKM